VLQMTGEKRRDARTDCDWGQKTGLSPLRFPRTARDKLQLHRSSDGHGVPIRPACRAMLRYDFGFI